MSAPALTLNNQKKPAVGFSALDVVGVSLSTLLFTIVWVSLFSIVLPEKSDMLFSEGFKKLSSAGSPVSVVDQTAVLAESVIPVATGLGSSTFEVVNTGGSIPQLIVLAGNAKLMPAVDLNAQAVLGASTQSLSGLSTGVVGYTLNYLNLLTFGLLEDVDPSVFNLSPVISAIKSQVAGVFA